MEHMLATYLRNSEMKDDVLYFGPMGCRTGFYLLVRNADDRRVLAELKKALEAVVAHEGEIFGNSRKECGNYRELSLEAAKKEAAAYLAVLESGTHSFRYPD
jgi:S-ribosylhomocysteine lyase